MRSRPAPRKTNSLRTFVIYALIVFFFILLSLSVKVYLLFQHSRFDGTHQFILALSDEKKVTELLVFRPQDRLVTAIVFKGDAIQIDALGRVVGVIPDATVVSSRPLVEKDAVDSLQQITWHFSSMDTNMTIVDSVRLFVAAQRAKSNTQEQEVITIAKDQPVSDQEINNLFVSDTLFAENISVQVINASYEPGLGRRLERSLKHLGCTVIDVSSARKEEKTSKILYYGDESYTVAYLAKILAFPSEKIEKKTIADIVIIIGNDHASEELF